MSLAEAGLLAGGGILAGVVNTLAGGGSMLTVPLLVMLGLPGSLANGTNRIGIVIQNAAAAWRFRVEGVSGLRPALPILPPIAAGSIVGAYAVAQLSDVSFERLFGACMLLLVIPTLRSARGARDVERMRPWSPATARGVFFAIGVYGGAIQAGVGLVLVVALSRAGFDLVRANSIKTVVILALTSVAVPVFIFQGQVAWLPAGVLAAGFAAGGILGARLAVRGGERLIRVVLAVAVVTLAGRMLGLY